MAVTLAGAAIAAAVAASLATTGYTLANRPDVPKLPDPQAPERAKQQAAAEAAARRNLARGFRSTILTKDFLAPGQAQLKSTLGS